MPRDPRFDDLADGAGGPEWDPTDLEYDDDGDWTEEDETRYQARRNEELKRARRTRRQALSFLLLVLLVLGAGLGAAGLAQGWWEWPFKDEARSATDAPTCGAPTPVAALPANTTVVVLNATDVRGLAAAVGKVLTERGFKVSQVGNEEDTIGVPESAQVRHGPDSLMEAKAVAAQFVSPVLVDDGRSGHVVEVSIGLGYRRMVDTETAAAAIAPVPGPSEAGCVPASPTPTTTEPVPPTTPAPTS